MSHYVIINSDQCLEYFPDNEPYRFRTYLQAPLNLSGVWKVALVDINLFETKTKTKQILYLHSNICGESIIDGEKEDLLRLLKFQKISNWSQSFDSPYYVPVSRKEIRDIEINIRDEKGKLATFLKNPVTVTLHFKSYPFF